MSVGEREVEKWRGRRREEVAAHLLEGLEGVLTFPRGHPAEGWASLRPPPTPALDAAWGGSKGVPEKSEGCTMKSRNPIARREKLAKGGERALATNKKMFLSELWKYG